MPLAMFRQSRGVNHWFSGMLITRSNRSSATGQSPLAYEIFPPLLM